MDITADPAAWVHSLMTGFLELACENFIRSGLPEKARGDPIIGFSRGIDPLYEQFKDHRHVRIVPGPHYPGGQGRAYRLGDSLGPHTTFINHGLDNEDFTFRFQMI